MHTVFNMLEKDQDMFLTESDRGFAAHLQSCLVTRDGNWFHAFHKENRHLVSKRLILHTQISYMWILSWFGNKWNTPPRERECYYIATTWGLTYILTFRIPLSTSLCTTPESSHASKELFNEESSFWSKIAHGQISVNFSPEDSQQTVSMGNTEINICHKEESCLELEEERI